MSDKRPTRLVRLQTWLFLILAAGLIVWGSAEYGFSMVVHERFWDDIAGRFTGPMKFRCLLQPTMALIAGVPDGIRDARRGHVSFFWSAWGHQGVTTGRLREGLESMARILLIGLTIDLIYQIRVFHQFYPGEAVMIALVLALLPYFIFRLLAEFIARRRLAGKRKGV
jgi:hypothetical protein